MQSSKASPLSIASLATCMSCMIDEHSKILIKLGHDNYVSIGGGRVTKDRCDNLAPKRKIDLKALEYWLVAGNQLSARTTHTHIIIYTYICM